MLVFNIQYKFNLNTKYYIWITFTSVGNTPRDRTDVVVEGIHIEVLQLTGIKFRCFSFFAFVLLFRLAFYWRTKIVGRQPLRPKRGVAIQKNVHDFYNNSNGRVFSRLQWLLLDVRDPLSFKESQSFLLNVLRGRCD